jgi:outer membrane protein assembly factor BamE (lipoprotein component of BamABCDE complex)
MAAGAFLFKGEQETAAVKRGNRPNGVPRITHRQTLALPARASDDCGGGTGEGVMRWILVLGLSGLLIVCAASGVKVSEQQAQSFKVGTSTYDDVLKTLGAPTSTTLNPDGTRVAAYTYAAIRSQPQNFIPIVNRLAAGYDKETSSVIFTFDRGGILTGTTSTQGGAAAGANLAAGSNAATSPYQSVR